MFGKHVMSRVKPPVGSRAPRRVWCWESLSSLGELPGLLSRLKGVMSARGYPKEDLFAVELSLKEAIVHHVKHGHGEDSEKVVRVRYQVDRECLIAEIRDEGVNFDPREAPAWRASERPGEPSGCGLLFIRLYMTSVHYNERGNRLVLHKQRSRNNEEDYCFCQAARETGHT